jgi:glyoxylase-like metal-dependent hydrolase (beta-lactamase superfamily II)
MLWIEIADLVFTRRYQFLDQQIGVVLGGREVLLIDTRASPRHARELAEELRELTRDPVSVVVDTHFHWDHAFGNQVFRPATIWGHVNAAERLVREGRAMAAEVAAALPELAEAFSELEIDPPDRTMTDEATIELGDRLVELRYLGRAHTEGDIAISVPDANVLFAGDLVEAGSPPSFGDSFPLEWPATVERLLPLTTGRVVPGHGSIGDRRFVEEQVEAFRSIASLARRIEAGELDLEAAIAEGPWGAETPRDALERGLAQLRGELQ